jgi:NitT/TauT family transport system permease protein
MTTSDPVFDADEARRARNRSLLSVAKWIVPTVVVALSIFGWHHAATTVKELELVLPTPWETLEQLFEDRVLLGWSLLITLQMTFTALAISIVAGIFLSILFEQSKLAELAFFPYAVVLQVTPIISIAPFVIIFVESHWARVLILSGLVAFFPILSNTTLGLKSTDSNLRDLYSVYKATLWQKLIYLKLPSSLPYFLGGLRIAGGLSLIGAIVAEYMIGNANGSGLAFRILESGYRYNYPRMFAALLLIAIVGVIIFAATSFISWFFLRKWHESALSRET